MSVGSWSRELRGVVRWLIEWSEAMTYGLSIERVLILLPSRFRLDSSYGYELKTKASCFFVKKSISVYGGSIGLFVYKISRVELLPSSLPRNLPSASLATTNKLDVPHSSDRVICSIPHQSL
jgi:hypothetical protein